MLIPGLVGGAGLSLSAAPTPAQAVPVPDVRDGTASANRAAIPIPTAPRQATPQAHPSAPSDPAREKLRPVFEDIRRGVDGGDPESASRLLTDDRMLGFLFDGSAAETFEKANALVDFSQILQAEKAAGDLRSALIRRLDPGSPLTGAGIGPSPESVLAWTALRSPEKLTLARQALLEWETLEEGQRGWLVGQRRTEERWRKIPVTERASVLTGWAQEESRTLLHDPETIDEQALAHLLSRSNVVAPLLPGIERGDLEFHVERVRLLLTARRALEKTGQREILDGLDQRFSLPVGERLEYLSSALAGRPEFKESGFVHELNSARVPRAEEAFSDEERRMLAERLAAALREAAAGTRAGERVLRFYEGGSPLALRVRLMPGNIGEFNAVSRDISLSEEFIQGWMRAESVSLPALLSDPAALRRLAQALCPAFVHEATHQMQHARRSGEDRLRFFTQDEEIEAFTVETLLVLERSLREPGYRRQVRRDDAEAADRLSEDAALFGRIVRRIYSGLPSFESFAASCLSLAGAMSRELARREAHPGSTPVFSWDFDARSLERGQFSLSNVALMTTDGLRQSKDFILRWYAGAAREMSEVRSWAERTRREILETPAPVRIVASAGEPLITGPQKAALAVLDPEAAELRIRTASLPRLGKDLMPAAAELAQAYALADLAELFDGIKRPSLLGDALRMRLLKSSPLASMGLDKEEDLLDWVRFYRPKKLKRVQAALMSWESLSPAQQASLLAQGYMAAVWDRQLPRDRDLNDWAQKELAALKDHAPLQDVGAFRSFRGEIQSLSGALPHEDRGALSRLFSQLKTELKLRLALHKRLARADDPSARELLAVMERDSGRPVSERLSALAAGLAARPVWVSPRLLKTFVSLQRPAEQERLADMTELPPGARDALFAELRGTPEGDAALALFEPGSAPAIAVENVGGTAQFADGRIIFDRSFIESWLHEHGRAAEAFRTDPATQLEFARYMADTLVHESNHFRQSSQRKQAGLPVGFTQEDEVEAYLAQREFLRGKKGKWPVAVWESAAGKHGSLLGGSPLDTADFVRKVMTRYPTVPSLRARLASQLWKISRFEEALERGTASPSKDGSHVSPDWLSSIFMMKDDRTTAFLYAVSLPEMTAIRDYLLSWILAAFEQPAQLRARLAQAAALERPAPRVAPAPQARLRWERALPAALVGTAMGLLAMNGAFSGPLGLALILIVVYGALFAGGTSGQRTNPPPHGRRPPPPPAPPAR